MNPLPPHPCSFPCASTAPTPTVQSLLIPGPSRAWNISKDRWEGGTSEAIPEGDEHSAPAGLGMGPPWTPPSAPSYSQRPGGQGLRDVWVQAWEPRGKIAARKAPQRRRGWTLASRAAGGGKAGRARVCATMPEAPGRMCICWAAGPRADFSP